MIFKGNRERERERESECILRNLSIKNVLRLMKVIKWDPIEISKAFLNLIHTIILLIRPTGFCNKGLFQCIPIMSHWIYKTFIIFHICRTSKYLDTEHTFCSWKAINFWKVCAELIRILTSFLFRRDAAIPRYLYPLNVIYWDYLYFLSME